MAEKRAWKCAGITLAQVTLISAGRLALVPITHAFNGRSTAVSKCTTWPLA